MSDLDSKLREIDLTTEAKVMHNPVGYDGVLIDMRLKLTDEAIAKIKEAFAEDGYFKLNDTRVNHLVSGRVWYDRFMNELEQTKIQKNGAILFHQVIEVAKKVSGL